MFNKILYCFRYLKRNVRFFRAGWSPLKLLNFFVIELEDYFNVSRVLGRPYSIFLDPVNLCPLQCPLCGTGLRQQAREKRKMSLAEFKRYVKPLERFLYEIKFFNYGEPFLNPDLPDMIAYAVGRKILTQVNTNLNVLQAEYAQRVVDAGLNTLVVSFDGLSQEAYGAYRRGGDIEIVKRNISLFNRLKQERNSRCPKIVLQYLVNRFNENEIEAAREYARGENAELFLSPIMIDVQNAEQRSQWLPQNNAYCLYDLDKKIKKKTVHDKKCGFLWNNVVINVDGGVAPCCHLYHPNMDFDNLNRSSFSAVWNGKKYRSARRIFREKKIHGQTLACERCLDIRAFSDLDVDLVNEHRTNNLK